MKINMNFLSPFYCKWLWPGLVMTGSLWMFPACADGTGVASVLNQQWQSVTGACQHGGNVMSALACSGVLVKPLPDTAAEKMMTAGGVLFLRGDLKIPASLSGAVLPAGGALNADEKAPGAACVRPVAVQTDALRAGYGCGAITHAVSNHDESEASTCSQQGTGPDSAGWKWDGSCSLSVEIHQEFSQALSLNRNSSVNTGNQPVQVWYRHWPATLAGAAPQALVYTSGDSVALKARQADRATLKKAGQDVPVLKYTPGAAAPFSYIQSDNDVPVLTRETVKKKLEALFDNRKIVTFTFVPPAFTKDNHSLQYPFIDDDTKTVKAMSPFVSGQLGYHGSYFTDLSSGFLNLNDNAILYGFIVDDRGLPVASIYAPYDSQSGREAAVALAKQYNIQTGSTVAVAAMNVKSITTPSSRLAIDSEGPFFVRYAGDEDEIQKGGEDTLAEKAQKVIKRYNDTRSSCAKNTPAWQCTGLIARATGTSNPFTQSSDVVSHRGVASYFFLRADTRTNSTYSNNQGIILKVPDSAAAGLPEGQKLLSTLKNKMKCIYPHDADTAGNHGVVGDFQCHKKETSPSDITSDYSDCATTLKLPADTSDAEAWVDAWNARHFTDSANQCSFSIQHTGQFYAAIWLTSERTGSYSWNELILAPSSNPNDIPELEAVWYQYGNSGSLNGAKEIARKYQSMRNVILPVIGWDYAKNSLFFEPDKQLSR